MVSAIRRHLGFLIALSILTIPGLLAFDMLVPRLGDGDPRYLLFRIGSIGIPREKIDTLYSPVRVEGWDENGLLLEDGRRIQLPGFTRLPRESAALAEAVSQGVQITSRGRVYGLVRIRIPDSTPVALKIDISLLLLFLGQGEPGRTTLEEELSFLRQYPPIEWSLRRYPPDGLFTLEGWDYNEYRTFSSWCGHFGYEAIKAPEGQKPPSEGSAARDPAPF
jgi:hypothetical protein